MDSMREVGGTRFISGDSDRIMLLAAIERGLYDLHTWAEETERGLDVGAITVSTRRVPSGLISVSVTGDLIYPDKEYTDDGDDQVTIDPEDFSAASRLADALIAEMCQQGYEWDKSRNHEVKSHMRAALRRFVQETKGE